MTRNWMFRRGNVGARSARGDLPLGPRGSLRSAFLLLLFAQELPSASHPKQQLDADWRRVRLDSAVDEFGETLCSLSHESNTSGMDLAVTGLLHGVPAVFLVSSADTKTALVLERPGSSQTKEQFGRALALVSQGSQRPPLLAIGAPSSDGSGGSVYLDLPPEKWTPRQGAAMLQARKRCLWQSHDESTVRSSSVKRCG